MSEKSARLSAVSLRLTGEVGQRALDHVAASCPGLGDLLSVIARSCPDVPFVADASSPEESVPLALLLHYLCGFIEEAVTRDWWPEPDPAEPDWESLRIAAVCHLVSQAEAAAQLHPDLHPPALAGF